jgi:hypothetical protein
MNTIFALRAKINFWLGSVTATSYRDHEQRVEKVRQEVVKWNDNGRTTKLCTARPGERAPLERMQPALISLIKR